MAFFFAGQIIYDKGGLRRIFVCWSYKGNPSWLLKSHFKEAKATPAELKGLSHGGHGATWAQSTGIEAAAYSSAHPPGPQPAGPSARHKRVKVRCQEQDKTSAPAPQCPEPRPVVVARLFRT